MGFDSKRISCHSSVREESVSDEMMHLELTCALIGQSVCSSGTESMFKMTFVLTSVVAIEAIPF